MIRFFRSLRQRLLTENRVSKYLLYALGEIALVMIGILLALQVNSWNDHRTNLRKSKEFHQRMIDDLDLIINSSSGEVSRSTDLMESLNSSVEILESGELNDSTKSVLDFALLNYYQMVRLNTELSSYEEMKSSGQIGLIRNTELRNKINRYVTFHNAMADIFDQLAQNIGETAVLSRHVTYHLGAESRSNRVSYNFESMAADRELINTLSNFALQWQDKLTFSKMIVTGATQLQGHIQENLANLK